MKTQHGWHRCGLLVAALCWCVGIQTAAAQYTFMTNNGTITITGYTGPGGAVTIPDTLDGLPVVAIGAAAFYNHGNVTSVTIPDSVTSIGSIAFYYCTSLTAITVDAQNPAYASVDGALFNKSRTTLIECPGGKAGSYAIPDGVTSIGYAAFYYCTSLANVTIPHSVTSIGDRAFSYCTSLTGVTIPSSVTSIGLAAFASCTSLTAITVDAQDSAYSSVDGVLLNKSRTTLIQYPSGKVGSYTIPNTVTSIGFDAFGSCVTLTSVTIPASVTSIGEYALYYCTGLTSVYFYGNAPSVDSEALEGDNHATVYYLAGATGWGPTFGGRPTALWCVIVSVTANPAQGGTVAGSGTYPAGTNVHLSATAASGWTFAAWSDGPTANPRTIVAASNLTLTASFVPSGPPWSKADFDVETIQLAPTALATGDAFSATVTVRNRGDKVGDAGMLRVWASHASWVTSGEAGNAEEAVGWLAPGESRTLAFAGLTAPAMAGTHQFRACVNADNVTPEYSWGDNQLPVTYTVIVNTNTHVTPEPSPIHYVAVGNPGAHAPYTNWTTAATCIQDAVIAASDGDTVLVTNGVYLLDSEIQLAKPVTVMSVNGPEATLVDGQGASGRCCFLVTTNAVVDGFTVRNGSGHLFGPGDNQGGGLCCHGAGEVRNCIIENNNAQIGGGVFCSVGCSVVNCQIRNNSAHGDGGVHCDGGAVRNCIVQGNSAFDVGGVSCGNGGLLQNCLIRDNCSYWCGGVSVSSGGQVENSTVVGNSASGYGGGGMSIDTSAGAVLNTIVYFNSVGPGAVGDRNLCGDTSLVSYCCLPSNIGGAGNITNAPLFADAAAGDYRLQAGSPCADAGLNQGWMAASSDLDGHPRIMAGAVDMGAYETPVAHHITVSCGANGSVGPGGAVVVVEGTDQTFQIQPDAGYQVLDVLVDNVSVGAVTSLTLHAVDADHTLHATFAPASWAKADFYVESVQLTTTTPAAGAAFGATVTVRNRGDIAGDAGNLRVWVSRATSVTPGEAGGAVLTVGRLAPGESRTLTFAGLAAPATAGTHQFRACVNADNVTQEYSWGDNQLTATYATVAAGGSSGSDASAWARPDFAVTEMTFVGDVPSVTEEPFTVRVTVANHGQISGNGGMLYLFASKANPAVAGDEATADAAVPIGIFDSAGAGSMKTFEVQLLTPNVRGSHQVRAYVVSPETEWSTGDNQLAVTCWIQTVMLQISVEPGVGIVLTWNNFWGDTYTVYRKTGLTGVFEPLAADIPSARPEPQNVFTDTHPPAGGSAFYKVGIQAH